MADSRKRIAILGSSGSIGTQALDVVAQHPDKLCVVALALNTRVDALHTQAVDFGVPYLAVGDDRLAGSSHVQALHDHIDSFDVGYAGVVRRWHRDGGDESRTDGTAVSKGFDEPITLTQEPRVAFGAEAVVDLVRLPEIDIVVNALVGAAGLRASYETLKAGKVLALANKESLVVGGDLIMPLATHDTLLPIDSEHGAIYQCLLGENFDEVACLWITASGGPFRGKKKLDLEHITPQQALAHPTWDMGAKISIDSSTLMNKGLEVIEAHHLFAMPYDRLKVVVQPQSAIHSMVEFIDGSVKAHLGTTDMRIPIQFALSYPDRWAAPVTPLDFRTLGSLEFEAPDTETFRCLALAQVAGTRGGTLPCAMNAANEVAVAAFLTEELGYLGIASCVEEVMERHVAERVENLEQLETVDRWARACARSFIER